MTTAEALCSAITTVTQSLGREESKEPSWLEGTHWKTSPRSCVRISPCTEWILCDSSLTLQVFEEKYKNLTTFQKTHLNCLSQAVPGSVCQRGLGRLQTQLHC